MSTEPRRITHADYPAIVAAAVELASRCEGDAEPLRILDAQNHLLDLLQPIEARPLKETIELPRTRRRLVYRLWETARNSMLRQSVGAQEEIVALARQLSQEAGASRNQAESEEGSPLWCLDSLITRLKDDAMAEMSAPVPERRQVQMRRLENAHQHSQEIQELYLCCRRQCAATPLPPSCDYHRILQDAKSLALDLLHFRADDPTTTSQTRGAEHNRFRDLMWRYRTVGEGLLDLRTSCGEQSLTGAHFPRPVRAEKPEGTGAASEQAETVEGTVTPSEGLGEREREVLVALLLLGSVTERKRVSRRKAARKADPIAAVSTYNRPTRQLVERGLVCSKKGPNGGIWLTPSGEAVAQSLREKSHQ